MSAGWQIGDKIPDPATNKGRWYIYGTMRGGMGIVYVVYDHKWHEVLAAKVFQDEIFARSPEIAQRFTQEALTWVNLDVHQNITEARFVQNIEGKPFLFLEYVTGGDLSGWISTPRLTDDLPQVLRFAIQFCDGIIHALSKGITSHRDIKPKNCLITQDRTLKITDFGLAKATAIQAGKGGRGGTPEYMPPEQWDNFERADQRADIYSFGVMLFQMITGQLPFIGPTWQELEWQHKTQPPPPLAPGSSPLKTVVETCLAKDVAHRYADFSIVRKNLLEIYESLETGEPAPRPFRETELDALRLTNKSFSLKTLGHLREALEYCDRSLELNPRHEMTWNNKGAILVDLGRPEEALVCYDRALKLHPRLDVSWGNKGAVLARLDQLNEALVCLNHALEINPLDAMVWNNKGSIMLKSDCPEEALLCFDRAIELKPRFELPWHNKGIALGILGRDRDALSCFESALEINPRFEQAQYCKGVALAKSGQMEEAIACFELALELNPRYADAWSSKEKALMALGRTGLGAKE